MQIIFLYINFKNPLSKKKKKNFKNPGGQVVMKKKKTPTIAKTFEFFFKLLNIGLFFLSFHWN